MTHNTTFINVTIDNAIVLIEEYEIALHSLGADPNDYRAGYIEGLKKAVEVLKRIRD